jgi:hypothetical protein
LTDTAARDLGFQDPVLSDEILIAQEKSFLFFDHTGGGRKLCATLSAAKRKCRAICRPRKIMLGIGHRQHGETPGIAG